MRLPRSSRGTTLGGSRKRRVALPRQKRHNGRADRVEAFGVFGHLADGNIHVEIYGPDPDDPAVDHAVFTCVARHGGSISAEHGVGRAKAAYLHLSRTQAELAAMRALKAALDPRGLMNPGALLPR